MFSKVRRRFHLAPPIRKNGGLERPGFSQFPTISHLRYFISLGMSWAATTCQVPPRLSQVSVQVSLTLCRRPSASIWIALSLPYKMAIESPKK